MLFLCYAVAVVATLFLGFGFGFEYFGFCCPFLMVPWWRLRIIQVPLSFQLSLSFLYVKGQLVCIYLCTLLILMLPFFCFFTRVSCPGWRKEKNQYQYGLFFS